LVPSNHELSASLVTGSFAPEALFSDTGLAWCFYSGQTSTTEVRLVQQRSDK